MLMLGLHNRDGKKVSSAPYLEKNPKMLEG
jgi:hypothetical protein